MADAVNAQQRNLYPRHDGSRFAMDYTNGSGHNYTEAMRRLSWTNPVDVPSIGQRSSTAQKPILQQTYDWNHGRHYVHPAMYGKLRHSDHLSFANMQAGQIGVGTLSDPTKDVFGRLYLGSKTLSKQTLRMPTGRLEMAGDIAFKNGDAKDAVELYSRVLRETPTLYAYEKRCAALAEIGDYRRALADAKHIMKASSGPAWGAAAARVRAIEDYMKRVDNYEPGYHQATSTLVCLLRPREHRQLVPSTPSAFGRPETATKVGDGMNTMASMASIMCWDRDGDGQIDMEEFNDGLRSLGYEPSKKEKSVFKGAGERGEV